MSKQEVPAIGRRDFFRRATLGVGAVGAAAVGLSATPGDAAVTGDSKKGAGYRETEHVKKYYELSKF